ncbi:hypothetical protein D9757_010471 [Collybiopsis confluens]|uniref:Uncharacterized protein n=1 Tax=Collybiopsis confluens TaxID=2823264 RepID=A0A8H5GRB6_9AGAR|nr:hypothetical protein D9757_010471 [Collybiopsis confluens]
MPPKSAPKIYQILIRTFRTTIFLTVPPSTTLTSLKQSAFDALNSFPSDEDAMDEGQEDIPKLTSTADFSLCRAVNVKPPPAARDSRSHSQAQKREYEVLDVNGSGDEDDGAGESMTVKDLGLANWEVLYVQYKDDQGQPLPIIAKDPPLDEEEDGSSMPPPPPPAIESSPPSSPSKGKGKGKRKAMSDDESDDTPETTKRVNDGLNQGTKIHS